MNKKVMIVEDEPSIFNLIETLLRAKGYDVQVAPDGNKALQSMPDFKPDLVLLDIMIPGVDGLEVCKIVKEHPETKSTKVVMLTSSKSEEAMDQAMSAGADWYIAKPFKIDAVIDKVKQLLDE